jgi:hypothetical protein
MQRSLLCALPCAVLLSFEITLCPDQEGSNASEMKWGWPFKFQTPKPDPTTFTPSRISIIIMHTHICTLVCLFSVDFRTKTSGYFIDNMHIYIRIYIYIYMLHYRHSRRVARVPKLMRKVWKVVVWPCERKSFLAASLDSRRHDGGAIVWIKAGCEARASSTPREATTAFTSYFDGVDGGRRCLESNKTSEAAEMKEAQVKRSPS